MKATSIAPKPPVTHSSSRAAPDRRSAPPAPHPLNGIDVPALQATIAAIKANPAKAITKWKIHSRWVGGTRSDHHVDGCDLGGTYIKRPFVIGVDEPNEAIAGGTDKFANPQEHMLGALNACMMVGYAAIAAQMGIKLTKLEIDTTGNVDLRGALGISNQIAPGYTDLFQTIRIAGNASAEQFARLHEAVRATSPNYSTLTSAVPVHSRMVVE
ncbi:MAG: OsmC family protein [Phycisphaerales bacterium]